jgi:glycosyltransferase involved in cell wall biosynthesis
LSSARRLLHVVATGERRGAEIFAADLIKALNDDGTEHRVVVLRAEGELQVRYPAPTLVGRRTGAGVRPGIGRVFDFRSLVQQWRPHAVLAHGGEALKTTVLSGARPIIYRRIGCAPRALMRGSRRALYAGMMKRAERIVAVSRAVQAETSALLGVPADRIVTIPNGVDPGRLVSTTSRDDVRWRLGITPAAPVILSIGATRWEKDPTSHLRIGASVLAKLPDAVHVFVGDGPLESDVRRAAAGLAVHRRIRFVGGQDSVAEYLMAADVLLFASRPDGMEGMPAVLIEAGMLGVPVAGFDVAGVSEVVLNGETGVLAPRGRADVVTARITGLLRDGPARLAMADAARRRCLGLFDVAHIAPHYAELCREVAAGR